MPYANQVQPMKLPRFRQASLRGAGCTLLACVALGVAEDATADPSVIGNWKLVSHTTIFDGKPLDSQAALLQQRPCAGEIVHEIQADGSYRLNTTASRCDEQYKKIQEKLYAKTQWKLEGDKLTTSSTNFAVGQTYTVKVSGAQMTWVGTEGQGTLVFKR